VLVQRTDIQLPDNTRGRGKDAQGEDDYEEESRKSVFLDVPDERNGQYCKEKVCDDVNYCRVRTKVSQYIICEARHTPICEADRREGLKAVAFCVA
jgi:hypothetical protein